MTINPLDSDPGEPNYFLYHSRGPKLRATFRTAGDARVWLKGNRGEPWADMFFITDREGNRVTFGQNTHGHAYAIVEAAK